MALEKSVVVPLDADETFALITEPDRLRRWQTVAARVDLRAGGDYRWTVSPGHWAAGRYVEVEPGRRVVFTWGWEGSTDLPPGASTVTITLEPTDGGTLVRLVHEGLSADEAERHAEGWAHYLERLAVAAVRGDAGPDAWTATPETLDRTTATEAALASCQAILLGIDKSDLDRPTPCPKYTVGDLVEHLADSLQLLGTAAGARIRRSDGAEPEPSIAGLAQQALEAWQIRGLDGTVHLGPNELPARIAADILPVELLVHGWDIATGTRQQIQVSDQVAGYTLTLARELITLEHRGTQFGAAIEPAPNAGDLDRLLAFTGRRA